MRPRSAWLHLFTCGLLAAAPQAQQPRSGQKRIYVEPFATKSGSERLRKDVTTELRKLGVVSIVQNEANADLILGGGGEIWVKGYRSFNPRSHMKLPTNGTPVYGGYLSVELKDRQGVTVWSYLSTPSQESEEISKDLAKQIAKHLDGAVNRIETPPPSRPGNQAIVALSGAGATFPYPVYQKWFTNFQAENPGIRIAYDPVGSEAGIRRLLAGSVDFAATDSPEAIHELAPAAENRYVLFPSVIGAVVPIVNLPGLSGDIVFTPEALAGIFLGKIKKWNDPILKRANPRVNLPDLDIVVTHRADGSGTSYAWSDYLSKTSPEWKSTVGASLAPKWPTGRSATGNDGVAKMVKELGGAIGYVEFVYALQNHLSYGSIRNQNGDTVAASLESIASALEHSPEAQGDLKSSIINAPGEGAYPIATFTWIAVPVHIGDAAKRSALTALLRWMLGPGQRQAAALGYLALPSGLAAREEAAIGTIR